jgi:Zn finger protein HypA/HybF involved in hydrogenase expression
MEIKLNGLEFNVLYKRANGWDSDWINKNENYSEQQIDFLLDITIYQNDTKNIFPKSSKQETYNKIIFKCISQDLINRVFEIINKNNYLNEDVEDILTSLSLLKISEKLALREYYDEALYIASKINSIYHKDLALSNIASELIKNENINKSIKIISKIEDLTIRDIKLEFLIEKLIETNNYNEAKKITQIIRNEDVKMSCIDKVFTQDEIHDAKDQTTEEIATFIEGLTNEQFEKIVEFFVTAPKIFHNIDYTCPKCGTENTVVVDGVENFFG